MCDVRKWVHESLDGKPKSYLFSFIQSYSFTKYINPWIHYIIPTRNTNSTFLLHHSWYQTHWNYPTSYPRWLSLAKVPRPWSALCRHSYPYRCHWLNLSRPTLVGSTQTEYESKDSGIANSSCTASTKRSWSSKPTSQF